MSVDGVSNERAKCASGKKRATRSFNNTSKTNNARKTNDAEKLVNVHLTDVASQEKKKPQGWLLYFSQETTKRALREV